MASYCGVCPRPEAAQYHSQQDSSVACSTFGIAVTKVNILVSIIAKTGCWDTVLGAIGDSCSYPLLKKAPGGIADPPRSSSKWLGVSALQSRGSSDTFVVGLPFTIDSS